MMKALNAALLGGILAAAAACAPDAPENSAQTETYESPEIAILAALNDPARPDYERERDADRKPLKVLALLEISPGDRVLELGAGDGYQARLLSAAVGPQGEVIAVNAPAIAERLPRLHGSLEQIAAGETGSNIEILVADFDRISFDAPLDKAVIGQFYHDAVWLGFDRTQMNARLFEALKPGGRLLVFDHAAEAGSGVRDAETLHRIDPELVREELLAAGFQLVDESDLLRNPEDPRDISIFAPEIRGKTDRFIYLFRKPTDNTPS
ncbi:MAG: class I SAM-dependent methyltransferase [Parvularculaceae bacterium]